MIVEDSSGPELSDPDAGQPVQDYEEFSESQEPQPRMTLAVTTTDSAVADPLRDSAPIILPITWGAVAGTLIWRGKVRSQWHKQGYDYDTFRLVAKMRGSPTRVELLNAMIETPKNKLQLAKELGVRLEDRRQPHRDAAEKPPRRGKDVHRDIKVLRRYKRCKQDTLAAFLRR